MARLTRRLEQLSLGALALAVCAVAGCGESRHPGAGVVRFEDGEPVRAGGMELRSLANGGHYASKVDREGRFVLADREGTPGVPPGEYEAVVVMIVMTDQLAAHEHDHGRNVPARYADYYTSGLRVRIDAVDAGPVEVILESD